MRRKRNPTVTEMLWGRPMQDEGDLYAVEDPITWRTWLKAAAVVLVVYFLLTAALTLGA